MENSNEGELGGEGWGGRAHCCFTRMEEVYAEKGMMWFERNTPSQLNMDFVPKSMFEVVVPLNGCWKTSSEVRAGEVYCAVFRCLYYIIVIVWRERTGWR